MLGQETMACGHPGLELGVELEVAAKLAKSKVSRFKCDDAAIRADQLGKMQGVRADIGSDIQHQRSGRDEAAQRGFGLALINISKVNGKIYALGKIQFVIDAAPHDDVPITAAKNGATGSKIPVYEPSIERRF
jgi:hypothetical protein